MSGHFFCQTDNLKKATKKNNLSKKTPAFNLRKDPKFTQIFNNTKCLESLYIKQLIKYIYNTCHFLFTI